MKQNCCGQRLQQIQNLLLFLCLYNVPLEPALSFLCTTSKNSHVAKPVEWRKIKERI